MVNVLLKSRDLQIVVLTVPKKRFVNVTVPKKYLLCKSGEHSFLE